MTELLGPPARRGRPRPLALLRRHGALVAFLALLAVNAAVTPNFLQLQTLYVNLSQVSTVAIVAVGMTLVIASGGIDLSVGALMALAGALAPFLFLGVLGGGLATLALACVLAVGAAGLCGLFNGWLVDRFAVQPIVATLVLFIAGRGLAQVLTGGELQTFDRPAFEALGTGRVLGVPIPALVVAAVALVAHWAVTRTLYGRYLLALGGNPRAAHVAGVPARAVRLATYAVSGLLAGVAGLMVSAINSASDANQAGLLMELDAIAAAVVGGALLSGGRAPVLGAVLGAAIIQLVEYTLLAGGVHDAAALIAKAAIILAAVHLQSRRA